jgi:membrane-bound lytic murein transglycosylase D
VVIPWVSHIPWSPLQSAGMAVAWSSGMRRTWLLASIAVTLLGAGPAAADEPPTAAPAQETAELRAEVDRLRTRLEWLEAAQGAPPRTVDAEQPTTTAQETADLRADLDRLRTRLEWLEAGQGALPRALHTFELPAKLEFAGEPVPLRQWDVGERLEREFLLALGNPAQVVLWLKRSTRYFPYIERELKRAGLPEDLKYVAVIESALLPGAYSHASALGIWQFIASTAKRYGLSVTSGWDERRNPERSTAAALALLRQLRQRFADWPLALAAYNTGEARIEQAIRHQGVSSYYQLALSEETERYVFRALAAKLILSEPERYGFEIPHEQRYRPYDADIVEIELRDRVAVTELARQARSFYREMKALNPEIVEDWLGKGRYAIRVPKGHGAFLRTTVGGPVRATGTPR